MNETRLFFVVDSKVDNEEIFPTLQMAEWWFNNFESTHEDEAETEEDKQPRLYIAIVNNAMKMTFSDKDKKEKADCLAFNDGWNYDDRSNTFEIVKQLK